MLASATGGSGCRILVLAAGSYKKLSISNRLSGVLERCAMPWPENAPSAPTA